MQSNIRHTYTTMYTTWSYINQRVTPYQHVQVEDGLEIVLPVQRERCSHVLGGGGGGGVTYDLGGGWWW